MRKSILWLILPLTLTADEVQPPDPNQPVPYSVVQRYWQEVLALRERNAQIETENVALHLENQRLRSETAGTVPLDKLDQILSEVRKLTGPRLEQVSWRHIAPDQMEGIGDRANDFHYVQRFTPVEQNFWDSIEGGEFIVTPPDFLPASPVLRDVVKVAGPGPQVRVTWFDRSNNETGFRIFRSQTQDGPWTEIADLPSEVQEVQLEAPIGTQAYAIRAFNENGMSAPGISRTVTVDPSTPIPKPPMDGVKTIAVETFVASQDSDEGGPGEPNKPDIATIGTPSTPYNHTGTSIGFNAAGEWTEWQFSTVNSQVWTGEVWMSNPTNGGRVEITVDGISLGTFPVPQTQAWSWFETVNFSVNLAPGTHRIRVISVEAGANGWTGDIAKIILTPTNPPPPP